MGMKSLKKLLGAVSAMLVFMSSQATSEPLYLQTDRKVKDYGTWNIPQYVKPDPNYFTLRFHLVRNLNDPRGFDKHWVEPSGAPYKFDYDLKKSEILSTQMLESSLLSYLLYEDGKITYDEITDEKMFGDLVKRDTQLLSNSIGKSLVSYLVGHAICAGYIESVDARLNDWPLIENTLYHNQKLIDLLNMKAGDRHVVDDTKGFVSTGRWYNTASIRSFVEKELKGTSPSKSEKSRPYYYNGFITNIVMNYVIFKSEGKFQNLLNDAFRTKARIENPVFFFINKGFKPQDGASWYMFYATPHDYLRIARAMVGDWQNNTCVGNYLKDVYSRSVNKGASADKNPPLSSRYAAQFHTSYSGMKQRNILGMEGYGGQKILMDMDSGRIVVVNSIHTDYDWEELVSYPMKHGKLRN
jgi:hypothetical protein